jgi:hypothetical protein
MPQRIANAQAEFGRAHYLARIGSANHTRDHPARGLHGKFEVPGPNGFVRHFHLISPAFTTLLFEGIGFLLSAVSNAHWGRLWLKADGRGSLDTTSKPKAPHSLEADGPIIMSTGTCDLPEIQMPFGRIAERFLSSSSWLTS